MTERWIIQDRAVRKSVKKAINEIHSEPIWGYVEAVINAFTAMRKAPAIEADCPYYLAGSNPRRLTRNGGCIYYSRRNWLCKLRLY